MSILTSNYATCSPSSAMMETYFREMGARAIVKLNAVMSAAQNVLQGTYVIRSVVMACEQEPKSAMTEIQSVAMDAVSSVFWRKVGFVQLHIAWFLLVHPFAGTACE